MARKEPNDALREALRFLGWTPAGTDRDPRDPSGEPPVAIRALAVLLSLLVRLTRRHAARELAQGAGGLEEKTGNLAASGDAEWTDSRIVSLCLSAPESSRPEEVGLLSAFVAHRRPGAPPEDPSWIPFEARPRALKDDASPGAPGRDSRNLPPEP